MESFKYRGIIGSYEYNEDDNMYYGSINIPDREFINFKGDSVLELHEIFIDVIDDYLLKSEYGENNE